MRWVRGLGVLLGAILVSVAHADTVYLKDGQAIWGTEAFVEGNEVVLLRPSGTVRFPKAQVERVEPSRISLPRFYSPPEEAPAATTTGRPLTPGAPGAAPAPGPGAATAPGTPRPPSEGAAPSPAPTALPPPPPPPAPPR
ncbi:MAG: hypothetical protein HY712_03215 [candidate division NC10 bacterium]|nr:hypothetical protein [candidate division NC10 bacterium]